MLALVLALATVVQPRGRPAPSPWGGRAVSLLGDEALIGRHLRGDGKAFELLVARHARLAGAVAVSVLGDWHGAHDVVQEAFVKVLSGLPGLDDPASFKGWLRHVVRTTALDHLRRRKVAGRGGDPLPEQDEDGQGGPLPAPGLLPEDLLEQAELRAQVRDEVGRLPESQREVVLLKYIDGRSYEEIAELTGLTVATIESRLFRARAALRRRLAERFGAAQGASRAAEGGG